MPKISPFSKHAPGLAARGFRVFPLRPRAKRPAIRGWQQRATTDVEQIAEWSAEFPQANVGVALDGRHVVVDVDEPTEFGGWLHRQGYQLPDTYRVRTGRGSHHYYSLPADVGPVATTPVEGGDLKASGLVVAAGSIHPDGGKYRLENDRDPAPAPAWLIEQIRRPNAATTRATTGAGSKKPPRPSEIDRDSSWARQLRVASVVATAVEGERNAKAYWAFRRAFMTADSEFVQRIEHEAQSVGLPPEEIESVMTSAYNSVKANYDVPGLR